jgi:hypothetical protein
MAYKRKHKKEIEQELVYHQNRVTDTFMQEWGRLYHEGWCEKYLENDEYAEWYDNWWKKMKKLKPFKEKK